MNLELTKPLAFFDLETTGLNIASDRIVEISIIKLMPNGDKEIKTKLVNPTIPISKESEGIHGITDNKVKDKATFKEVASELNDFIKGCDLAGYNSNRFDIPLIAEEFLRAGIDFDVKSRNLIDVQNIFHKMEQRTLVAAYKFYCSKDLTEAHSAEADTTATYEILEAQIAKYADLKGDTDFLSEFSQMTKNVDLLGRFVYNEDNIAVFNFGKHKGKAVAEVLKKEPGYFSWMMNGDFPLYTKKVLKEIKESMTTVSRPVKKAVYKPKPLQKKQAPKEVTNSSIDMLKNKFNS
jgi:DNA polymerase-3 subunit epsilon